MLALAQIWRHREKIEWEAAAQFDRLAVELESIGCPRVLVDMAERAANDEREHAVLCRAIVDDLAPGLAPLKPNLSLRLGPLRESRARRTLYATVAISCVTETLSAALLCEMRTLARSELVRDTVHRILKDEVDHSRLGWAHLAFEAQRSEVGWLSKHIAGMVDGAIGTDVRPMAAPLPSVDPSAYGVLSRPNADRIAISALSSVVFPGLERYGIDTDDARALVERMHSTELDARPAGETLSAREACDSAGR